jgi:hypothetical protein
MAGFDFDIGTIGGGAAESFKWKKALKLKPTVLVHLFVI